MLFINKTFSINFINFFRSRRTSSKPTVIRKYLYSTNSRIISSTIKFCVVVNITVSLLLVTWHPALMFMLLSIHTVHCTVSNEAWKGCYDVPELERNDLWMLSQKDTLH